MQLQKAQLEQFVHNLPDQIDADELMYRIYLMQKIEAGEQAILQGKTVTHEELCTRMTKRCAN
ncbi:MAG: hypothetical protein OEL57_11515 [Trichlorobacter sp.]|uniref:hypothetical protein n=1 Tax=Trichlorobacter sp. TaxID=2911007 RepID=UPI0025642E63|nr:hypothetical protein [Trichlorobacter sp.]MDK9718516.1 hypothetical protein [Trichlorobacter sp.]